MSEGVPPKDAAPSPGLTLLGVLMIAFCLAAVFAGLRLEDRLTAPAVPDDASFAAGPPGRPADPGAGVHLVALGRADDVDLESVAAYVEDTLDVQADVLPAVGLMPSAYDEDRQQIEGSRLVSILSGLYPTGHDATAVVAVTDFDMYEAYGLLEPFALAARGNDVAVVSTARLGPGLLDRVLLRDPTAARVRKLVAREAGLVLFRRDVYHESGEVLEPVSTIAELDALDDELPLGIDPP